MKQRFTKLFFIMLLISFSLIIFQAPVTMSAPAGGCCSDSDCGDCQRCNSAKCPEKEGSCIAATGTCDSCSGASIENCKCSNGECVDKSCGSGDACGACETCSGESCVPKSDGDACTECTPSSNGCVCKGGSCVAKSISVVCGMRSGGFSTLDMIMCCNPPAGVTFGEKRYVQGGGACNSDEAVCGVKNVDSNNYELQGFYCCKMTGAKAISCIDSIGSPISSPNTEKLCPTSSVVHAFQESSNFPKRLISFSCCSLDTSESLTLKGFYDNDVNGASFYCPSDASSNPCVVNGKCEGSETEATCPADCGCNYDGNCSAARLENLTNCVFDCAPCNSPLRNSLSNCSSHINLSGTIVNHTQCGWCSTPKTPIGSEYPYVEPNQNITVVEGVSYTCANKTNDPFNCGGCGFFVDGLRKYFKSGEGGFCKADVPFCVDKKCAGVSDAGAAASATSYRASHSDANPYYQPYTVSCDSTKGCQASIGGVEPVFSYTTIDENSNACTAGGGTLTEAGCCGGGKCRSDGDSVCQTTDICDGSKWHLAGDTAAAGEVFKTTGCFNSFPIASVSNELVKCVDEDKYYEYILHTMEYDTDGCLPNELLDDSNKTIANKCENNKGCPSEGSTQWVKTGDWPYSCPAGYYQGATVRTDSSVVAGDLEPGCGLHSTVDKDSIHFAELGGYLVCLGDFGFASLIDTGTKGLSFKNMEFSIGADSSAYCPAPISKWKEFGSGGDVSEKVLIPCPGKIAFDPVNAEGIYEYGAVKGMNQAILCAPQPSDGWQSGLYALGFVRGNGSTMGSVNNHSYACITDYSKNVSANASRSLVAICCGSKGCSDIKGTVVSGAGLKYNVGGVIKNVSGTGKSMFCLDDGTWSFDLDFNTTQAACKSANFQPTGNYCCAEGDDTSTWINESYNEPGGSNGSCFKGTSQRNNFFLNYNGTDYAQIFVYNGSFLGCGFNDSLFNPEFEIGASLCVFNESGMFNKSCLQKIEDWPDPGANFSANSPFRTNQPLIKEIEYCTLLNSSFTNYYCSYNDVWSDSNGENYSHQSKVPLPLLNYLFNFTGNLSNATGINFSAANCCRPNECWDPKKEECIYEQLGASLDEDIYIINSTTVYKCLQGNWTVVNGSIKKTPAGCDEGICPSSTQCLYSLSGNPAQNNNVSVGSNPQCIEDGQYFRDFVCSNGSWSSRTKLLAQKMASLADGGKDFILMCALPEESLISQMQGLSQSQNTGDSNNFCILHLNPGQDDYQRILGTTLNQPFVASTTGDSDFINALETSFFMSYPDLGITFNSDCTSITKDFEKCIDNEYLKLYYDDDYQMVVFSDKDISGLNPNLGENICDALPSWLKWLCPKPSQMELNFENLRLFNKVYATKQSQDSQKSVFGVAEQVCNSSTTPPTQKWVYAFNYTGFTFPTDFIISSLDAEFVNMTDDIMTDNIIYILNPKNDAWTALTLLRNPEQE